MAKSHDTSLSDILRDISDGTTQLPDFQRGWVWDDERIKVLIASITCSYPVGAVMFLECGGSGIRFKSRMFTGVPDSGRQPETLVLDGQQRLTSIYCAMYGRDPVPTRTAKKDDVLRYYYLDIEKCLAPDVDRVDSIIAVPEDRQVKEDFGRRVVLDLSTRQDEFKHHLFSLNIVFDSIALDEWKDGLPGLSQRSRCEPPAAAVYIGGA